MAQITTLATTENGKNSRVIINTNFDNLNTEVEEATSDIATLEATVNTGALAGTSGTPSGTNRFVTDDDTSSTPSPNKVVRFTSEGELSGVAPVIEDSTYPAGETLSAGNVVFIENAPTTAQATSAQNIGDVTANTRVSFPVFGSGVAGTTLALNLAKVLSPSVSLGVRIETDNAGSPSGTLVDANATGTVAAASLLDASVVLGEHGFAERYYSSGGGERLCATVTVGAAKINNIIVKKLPSSSAFTCVIKLAGVEVASTTFTGLYATFPVNITLSASTVYTIYCNASNGYDTYPNNSYTGTNLSMVGNGNSIDQIAGISSTKQTVDTTVTLAGSITIPAGQKCHLVTYQGTYGSETVNASNYYKIGYYTNDSTTRGQKLWNGSVHSAMDTVKVPYTSSTIFQPRVLSKTDADYSYMIDWHGIAQEAVTAGELTTGKYPKIAVSGIDSNQTGMTQGTTMYLGNTPGTISSSAGTEKVVIGEAISSSKLQLGKDEYLIVSNGTVTAASINLAESTTGYSSTITTPGVSFATVTLTAQNSGSSFARLEYNSGNGWSTLYSWSPASNSSTTISFMVKKGQYRIYGERNYGGGGPVSGTFTTTI